MMKPNHPIAFIGLGHMGGVILRRLDDAGLALRCHDIRPGLAASFASGQVHAATSLADAVSGTHLVLTCLPTPAAIEAAYLGDGGLVARTAAGAICVDLSTNHPELARRIGAALAERGIGFVDAPVAGGVARAVEGRLSVMAGGSASDLEIVRPVLEHFAGRVFHTGAVGTGCTAKVINNLVALCNMLNMSDALALAAAQGIDPLFMDDVIASGSGQNTAQQHLAAKLRSRDWSPSFTVELARKDIGLALSLAEAAGLELPTAQALADRYDACIAQGWGGLDMAAMARPHEARLFGNPKE